MLISKHNIIVKQSKFVRESFSRLLKKIVVKTLTTLKFYIDIMSIKLNVIIRRKKRIFLKKRNNINKTTCYTCDKLNYYYEIVDQIL